MKKLTGIMLATVFMGIPIAHAAEPENIIKYRQSMMKAIGGHMSSTSQIVRGKVSLAGDLEMHARALADLNANLTRLFPEGSDFGETKSKGDIWDNWAKFEAAADTARDATAKFAQVVASGDQGGIAAAFKDVGNSCKGCHKDFRQKDD